MHLVHILDTEPLRLFHQKLIKIRSEPMRVGDRVVRTCRDKEVVLRSGLPRTVTIQVVVKEGESALEAAGEIRIFLLPTAPLRQRTQCEEVVALCKILEQ